MAGWRGGGGGGGGVSVGRGSDDERISVTVASHT